MSRLQSLRVLVSQRLAAAVEEIFGHFERTIAEYEEELGRRHRRLLDVVLHPETKLRAAGCPADVQQLSLSHGEVPPEQQERSPSLDQQDPAEPPHIKEEQEDLWTSQEGEQLPGLQEADGTKVPFTPVPVKSEEDEEKPQSSQLHQRLPEHMETGAAGEDCGGPGPARDSEPDSHLHPDADDGTGMGRNNCKSYRCSECGKRYGSCGYLKLHMRSHTGERPYKCSVCRKSFSWSGRLQKHMKIHTGEKPFSCSVCGKGFIESGNMKVHMRIHTGEKPFSCSVCGKRYAQRGNLKQHMAVHRGENIFSCSVCDKVFTWLYQLRSHKCVGRPSSRLHQAEPPASSSAGHMETGGEDCGGPGPARDSDPDSHLHPDADHKARDSSETEDSDDGWQEAREPQSGLNSLSIWKKSFSCSECGQRFGSSGILKRHVRSHTGERPFSCSVCGKCFYRNGCLQKHMKIHTGEKPFSCSVCGKGFIESGNMKVHMRIHTGEKPFSCSVCGKSYRQKGSLTTHLEVHRGEK